MSKKIDAQLLGYPIDLRCIPQTVLSMATASISACAEFSNDEIDQYRDWMAAAAELVYKAREKSAQAENLDPFKDLPIVNEFPKMHPTHYAFFRRWCELCR